uniref:Peptidase S1 domain-containing protein n=1 Tax=Varanus komodoensis TaxID=61221 RepID=A0A8D2J910_VARKO
MAIEEVQVPAAALKADPAVRAGAPASDCPSPSHLTWTEPGCLQLPRHKDDLGAGGPGSTSGKEQHRGERGSTPFVGSLQSSESGDLEGQPACNGSWPWQVHIFRGGYPICGGALITDEWVLSAAHCFRYVSDICCQSNVQKIILHPDYDGKAASSGDIALLKLLTPVKFTDYIFPICLPNPSIQLPQKTDCWVSGWVDTQGGVSLISRGTCNNLYKADAHGTLDKDPIKPDEICAEYPENGKDAHLADSGGPLICKLNGSWTQGGIMSWETPKLPAVYTSVSSYTKWIHEMMTSKNWGDANDAPIAIVFLMFLPVALL